MTQLILIGLITFCASGSVIEGEVTVVTEGYWFTEGPLYTPELGLLFSDIPADAIYKADKTVFRKPSGESNGLTMDQEGRLIACEHKNRRVTRTEKDGQITVLAETYDGKKLNSPNDVVVRSDGMIFFTDPPYGLPGGLEGPNAELSFAGVYAVASPGQTKLLISDFIKPNGLAFSPDEKILYVADTEGKHVRAFDVSPSGDLSNDRVFCQLPGPDGMKVDVQGNVWCTASDGVRVHSPQGTLLETIAFPQAPANCAFGDDDYSTLYVTARKGVYKVRSRVAGVRPGPKTSNP